MPYGTRLLADRRCLKWLTHVPVVVRVVAGVLTALGVTKTVELIAPGLGEVVEVIGRCAL
jgi:hypothetical protein